MRTLTLALAALLFAPSALAQTYAVDKGSYLLGGNVAFSSIGSNDGNRSSFFTLSPSFSRFVLPGLALGASASFARTSGEGYTYSSLGVGPRVAYYFGGTESRTYPYVASQIDYIKTESVGSSDPSTTSIVANLSAGLAFMLVRNVGLNAEAFYQTAERGSDAFGIRGGVVTFLF